MWILGKGAALFDAMHNFWENPRVSRRVSFALVVIFLCAGGLTLLRKVGVLPEALEALIPSNPFFAINLAFALVLGIEVVALIFAVADSVSRAVGKQIEIMALILLRDIFKDISHLENAHDLVKDYPLLAEIVSLAVGALLLFLCLGVYVKLHRFKGYIRDFRHINLYIAAKKCVSLLLFIAFITFGAYDLYIILLQHKSSVFFLYFYSILIFSDILLVLVAQCFMPSFHATFRNSGYAAGTLLMRIALGAPPIWGAALSVFAAVYVIGLTWATNRYEPAAIKFPPHSAKVGGTSADEEWEEYVE